VIERSASLAAELFGFGETGTASVAGLTSEPRSSVVVDTFICALRTSEIGLGVGVGAGLLVAVDGLATVPFPKIDVVAGSVAMPRFSVGAG
jgi:hypothetical protein